MISAVNISKSFGDKAVIRNVSRDFATGSVTCVTGPSGCGKTTFLGILMGIIKPDAGSVTGAELKKAAVFQDDRLLGSLTTFLNARLAIDDGYSRKDAAKHLEMVGLSDSLDKPASSLSGGMKKRLGIVRAVLSRPEILFLDEPFNGIDAQGKKVVRDYIYTYLRGATIIMVTHDKSEIELMNAEVYPLGTGV